MRRRVKKISILTKLAGLVLLACAIPSAVGFVSAHQQAPNCRNLVVSALEREPKYGTDYTGRRIRAEPADIEVEVQGPYQVTVVYSVPTGLHAAIYRSSYWAVPWGCSLREKRVIHLT